MGKAKNIEFDNIHFDEKQVLLEWLTGGAYAVNKYVAKNDFGDDMYKKLAIIAATSVGSELIADFYTQQSQMYV